MTATHTRQADSTRQEVASGLTVVGGVLLMIVGVLDICRGIMAIAEDDIFVTTPDYVFEFDLTGWGWIHVALGALAVLISLGLVRAATWARIAGVAIAALVVIANFLSLPYYPIWSVVMIAMSAFIIWALCVVRRDESFDTHRRSPGGR
ncbi:UNVERIFIED_CONTAM: hypothetical protein RKD43_000422 [Streptomyces graminofaciens]